MKWFWTPMAFRLRHDVLADAVVDDALAFEDRLLLALKAVASSLKYWIRVPGSGPS
jgi:hypothetical protein